jgi:hypothetical protein
VNTEPVVLLPLRLETRYSLDRTVLRVRIYPDDIHVDALDRGVDDAERDAAVAYWQAVWDPTATPPADPWAQLVGAVGARRAGWVAEALRPTNEAERPAIPPVFPAPPAARTRRHAEVQTLPARFRAYAYSGVILPNGVEEAPLVADGEPVPDPLPVAPPTESDGTPVRFVNGVPLIGEELRWLVDFEAAKAAGMGLEVRLPEPGHPVDRLIVVGVRDELDPAASADRLANLIRAHAYTDGGAFLPQGTPTNNTDTDRTAWSRRLIPPAPKPATQPAPGSNAEVLASFLDVPASAFAALDHADATEQDDARAMLRALWGATWEVVFAKLTHPTTPGRTFTAAQREELREHAVTYLRGRGPIPALRIGRQPYGVLPALHLDAYLAATVNDAKLVDFLKKARRLWRAGVANVPTVMTGDLESALPEILGSSPVMLGLRIRSLTQINKCYEPLPFLLDAQDNCATQEGLDKIAHEYLGFDPTELTSAGLLGKAATPAAMPLTVDGEDGDAAYIQRLLDGNPPESEHSILQALLGLAAAIEADEWANATADDGIPKLHDALSHADAIVDVGVVRAGLLAAAEPGHPDTIAVVTAALRAITATGVTRFDPGTIQAAYPVDAIRPKALVTGATRRRDSILTDPTKVVQISGELLRRAAAREEFRAALARLRDFGSAQERALALAEVLDTASHRLDAWVTSLATRGLLGQRRAGIRGVTLGAYGFVQHIAPAGAAEDDLPAGLAGVDRVLVNPRDGGYVHAPSLDQAATVGVLRSARLTHDAGDSGDPALDLDLSSPRVRTAMHVLDGIRQGQPLGALLGYRLERWLHEGSRPGRELDRYVYVLRSLAPLRAAKQTQPAAGAVEQALETVAATDVVDGVRLLELFTTPTGPETIIKRLTDGPDDAKVRKYLGSWARPPLGEPEVVLKAIAELEQVHDAVADLLLAESVHQLVRGNTAGAAAALDAAGGGDSIPPDPDVVRTPRSGTAYTHRLVVLTPAPSPAGNSGWSDEAPLARAHPRLEAWARAQLGPARRVVLSTSPPGTLAGRDLCALDVVTLAGPALRARLGGEPLEVRPAEWGRGTDRLLLAEVEELSRSLRALLAAARPLTPAALAAPSERDAPPRTMDLAPLRDRAVRARDDLAAALGPDARQVLVADAALNAADAAEPDAERLRSLDAALAAVFGPGLPALPDLLPAPGGSEGLAAALAAGRPPAGVVRQWLSAWGAVRAPVGRYAETTLYRQALGADLRLRVLQLGVDPALPWVGLPFGDAPPPAGPVLSLVAEVPGPTGPGAADALAGFVVDEWVDVVPSRIATTAAAVNAEVPSARPPQVVLLAVTADGAAWTLDKLRDVVDDTVRLAQERAVTLERVPLAPRILPALYVNDWSLQAQGDPVLFVSELRRRLTDRALTPKFVKG